MNDLQVKTDFNQNALAFIRSIDNSYKFHIRNFCGWMERTGRSLDKEQFFQTVKDYIIEVNNDNTISASTKRLRRQALKKALKLMTNGADAGNLYLLDLLLKNLDENKETKSPGTNTRKVSRDKVITAAEYYKLVDNARSDKQRRFIEFLFNTGCRVSEMLEIRIKDDITIGPEFVGIRVKGKGSRKMKYKERPIMIPLELYNDILRTFDSTDKEFLFSTSTGHAYNRCYVSNQLKKLGKAILSKKISAHTFRHGFVTLKIQETGDIKAVSEYVGHSSVSITLDMYTHTELKKEQIFKSYYRDKVS